MSASHPGGKEKKYRPTKIPLSKNGKEEARPPGNLSDSTTLTIDGQRVETHCSDLKSVKELGRGAYGVVEKMVHQKSKHEMAVKRIRASVNTTEQKRLLMDLDVSMRLAQCPYTVQFYGALFKEGDVWICMELMTTSLERFYKSVSTSGQQITEPILGKIAFCVVNALEYLHSKLSVIHRDVKPSNILINYNGDVKLCDFGISGQLVDSMAKTMEAGCKPYMAPERIDPSCSSKGYDIRSDVWSFGITMAKISTGNFPYQGWKTPFDQLRAVVESPSPSIPVDLGHSDDLHQFVDSCLKKDFKGRPYYTDLLEHPFITKYKDVDIDVAEFVKPFLEQIEGATNTQ
ncbi:dual specificity mitogen-activated protein kinase kinase 6-like [Rhopilema esculentum]|uniref:dual specificity mitogen-activated protein kinase kinase 6-like n=1 Tax=Rhopilema esculentum TaxID=499914 RepID=UPI0031D81032